MIRPLTAQASDERTVGDVSLVAWAAPGDLAPDGNRAHVAQSGRNGGTPRAVADRQRQYRRIGAGQRGSST